MSHLPNTLNSGDLVLREWLNSVGEMVILNGAEDFHFSEDVIQALAYAYHKKFVPVEAAVFYLLAANKMADDPDEMRKIEARAKELMQTAKSEKDYNAGLIRWHLWHYLITSAPPQRQPEPSRSPSLVIPQGDLRSPTAPAPVGAFFRRILLSGAHFMCRSSRPPGR